MWKMIPLGFWTIMQEEECAKLITELQMGIQKKPEVMGKRAFEYFYVRDDGLAINQAE